MDSIKYFIKVGDRYLSWVDENWYETNKKGPSLIDNIIDVKNTVSKLSKHYVYTPTIFEVANYDFDNAKEIKVFKAPKLDPYFDKEVKPVKIKCKITF